MNQIFSHRPPALSNPLNDALWQQFQWKSRRRDVPPGKRVLPSEKSLRSHERAIA